MRVIESASRFEYLLDGLWELFSPFGQMQSPHSMQRTLDFTAFECSIASYVAYPT